MTAIEFAVIDAALERAFLTALGRAYGDRTRTNMKRRDEARTALGQWRSLWGVL